MTHAKPESGATAPRESVTSNLVAELRALKMGRSPAAPVMLRAASEIEQLRWALHCCETSLSTYDEGANAEYWLRKRDGEFPSSAVDTRTKP